MEFLICMLLASLLTGGRIGIDLVHGLKGTTPPHVEKARIKAERERLKAEQASDGHGIRPSLAAGKPRLRDVAAVYWGDALTDVLDAHNRKREAKRNPESAPANRAGGESLWKQITNLLVRPVGEPAQPEPDGTPVAAPVDRVPTWTCEGCALDFTGPVPPQRRCVPCSKTEPAAGVVTRPNPGRANGGPPRSGPPAGVPRAVWDKAQRSAPACFQCGGPTLLQQPAHPLYAYYECPACGLAAASIGWKSIAEQPEPATTTPSGGASPRPGTTASAASRAGAPETEGDPMDLNGTLPPGFSHWETQSPDHEPGYRLAVDGNGRRWVQRRSRSGTPTWVHAAPSELGEQARKESFDVVNRETQKENTMSTSTAAGSTGGSATGDAHDVETAIAECNKLDDDLISINTALDVIDEKIDSAGTAAELIEAFLRSKNVDDAAVGGMSVARDMLSPTHIKALMDAIAAARQGVQAALAELTRLQDLESQLNGADGSVLNGR